MDKLGPSNRPKTPSKLWKNQQHPSTRAREMIRHQQSLTYEKLSGDSVHLSFGSHFTKKHVNHK
jgi:hypothetical protein